jgi:uncharacterized protein (UPF0335 family)
MRKITRNDIVSARSACVWDLGNQVLYELKGTTIDFTTDGSGEIKLTKKQQAELLRQKVDTVEKIGQPGEQVQNVISVGMLSEGWDAKTVTHIMGLRAENTDKVIPVFDSENPIGSTGRMRTWYTIKPL